MCRASTEKGGPARCSGDARSTYLQAVRDVDRLEQQLTTAGPPGRPEGNAALHAALRAAVLDKTDADPEELDREVAAATGRAGPPQPRAKCFFCDSLIGTDSAAHITGQGKVCCRDCWPDVRLTSAPGGGL